MGRGGADYTAAILASAVDASVLEIWTDVSGMMTADPRLVNNSKQIPQISYQEAMELSHFGAKAIYPPTIQPMMKKGLTVWIKNIENYSNEAIALEIIAPYTGHSIAKDMLEKIVPETVKFYDVTGPLINKTFPVPDSIAEYIKKKKVSPKISADVTEL